MSLFNILVHLPHEQLRRLANEFGVSSASPSKRTILNELAACYRDDSFVSALVDELSVESRGFLQGLVFFTPQDQESIGVPAVLQQAWTQTKSLTDVVTPLLDVGLLFLESSMDEKHLILPEEIRNMLQVFFSKPYQDLLPCDGVAWPSEGARLPCLEAIFHLAGVVLHHRAVHTQKGTLHRKVLDRWAARMERPFPREEFYDFILDFCERQHIFSIHGIRMRISAAGEEWFAKEERVHRDELWNHALDTRLLSDSSFQPILMFLCTPRGWIEQNGKLPIYSFSDLYGKGPLDSAKKWLTGLQWLDFLGMVQLDRPAEPQTVTLTRDGIEFFLNLSFPTDPPPVSHCILQPNYDLLVPPSVDYATLWKLEQLAEFKRRDVFTEYHLSQPSILSGMRRGWMKKKVFSFLEELTGEKIPENVEYSLEEWCGKYGQITFRRTVLVECASPELAEEIAHIPDINRLLESRVSERGYAVAESNARHLLHLLRERGYEPAAKRLSEEG